MVYVRKTKAIWMILNQILNNSGFVILLVIVIWFVVRNHRREKKLKDLEIKVIESEAKKNFESMSDIDLVNSINKRRE